MIIFISRLDRNQLQTLPESLCDLKMLEECFVKSNLLRKLPQNFSKLEKLKVLFENLLITFSQISIFIRDYICVEMYCQMFLGKCAV